MQHWWSRVFGVKCHGMVWHLCTLITRSKGWYIFQLIWSASLLYPMSVEKTENFLFIVLAGKLLGKSYTKCTSLFKADASLSFSGCRFSFVCDKYQELLTQKASVYSTEIVENRSVLMLLNTFNYWFYNYLNLKVNYFKVYKSLKKMLTIKEIIIRLDSIPLISLLHGPPVLPYIHMWLRWTHLLFLGEMMEM